MRVTWSPEALDAVARISDDRVAALHPAGVQDLAHSLVEAADRLLTLPHRGRPLLDGRHELNILRPYVIIYRLWGAEARILAVWHAAHRLDGVST